MTARRLSFFQLSAILCGSVALWVSFGTLTIAGPSRLGVLPSLWWLLAAFAIIVVLAVVAGRRRAVLLWLSGIILLAWLPIPAPAAATYMWTGPLRWALWSALAVGVLTPALMGVAQWGGFNVLTDPRRAPGVAAALAATVYLLAAWQVFPQLPAGDEPHYLVIAQSLLKDGDLKIENNHLQGDYEAYIPGPLRPHYLTRGVNHEIYSVHAPGLPAVVAPVFAVFGYPGVLGFLALVSGCATALAWRAVWLVTRDVAASWFGWATVSLSVPFLFQAFAVYPDGFGAALVMTGVLTAILGERASPRLLLVTGLALALLPWLHTRFAVTAGALGLVILARQITAADRVRRVIAFAAPPIVSAIAWFSFFYVLYGTPNPAAPYGGYTQTAVSNIPQGLAGLLFDQQFGLVPKAPVYLCALVGFVPLARRQPRLAAELALVVLPYTIAASLYAMWWGGFASPARFLASILLPLALPAGMWFATSGPAARILGLGLLLLSVLSSAATATVGRGELLLDVRTGTAKILGWASPLVDLSTGLPSLFQTTLGGALARTAIWLLAVATTAGIAAWLDRRRTSRVTAMLGVGFTAAVTGMTALSLVWALNAAHPLTPFKAGPHLLRAIDGNPRQLAVRYAPFGRIRVRDVPPLLTLQSPLPPPQRPDDPLALVTEPSAATYTIEATVTGNAGHLTAGIDRTPAPLWTWDLSGVHGKWSRTLTLANDAGALRVDGDAATHRAIGDIIIRAERRLGASERVSDRQARRAARYGHATVFLLDGTAYVEPAGSWIGGGSAAEFAIVPDAGASIQLFVRNFSVDNTVVLESGGWRQDLALKPNEERMFEVPIAANRPGVVLRVRSATGARPADVEPGNQDKRMLGCWIETR